MHDKSSKITKELANLFNESEEKELVRPFAMKKAIDKELPDFAGFDQCDAQEFLTYFLNRLSEDLIRNPQSKKDKKK